MIAGTAQARTETLRWTHSAPNDVVNFEAYFGSQPGSYDNVVNLGKPTPDANGVYTATIEVGSGDVYIALRAVGALSTQSPLSNERARTGTSTSSGGTGGATSGGTSGGTGTGTSTGTTVTPIVAGTTMPASLDAVKRFDFTSMPLGDVVTEWVDTRAGNSLLVEDTLFVVGDIGGNHVLTTTSSDFGIHSHVVSPDGPWSAYTVRGRMAVDRDGAGIGVTTYSQYPNADVYYRLGRDPAGAFTITGHPALSCTTGNTGVVPTPGAWYAFELTVQVANGNNQILAKVWRQGTAEPGGPQAACTDTSSSKPTAGTLGVWASADGQKAWDDLEIITAQPAPSAPLAPPILIQVVPAE
jgi:hypothetical protein